MVKSPPNSNRRAVIGHCKMTTTDKIITLARRYCSENFSFWADKYSNEKSGNNNPYSDNDYNIFPRYNTLTAILKGVEKIVGKSFDNIDQCKNELKSLGQDSQTPFTKGKQNEIEKKAIQDERQKFIHFIDSITDQQIETVEPLPYRRRLLEKEANEIREKLLEYWNFDGSYWEPLTSCSPKPFIFFTKDNLTDQDYEKIKKIIADRAENKIYEITEEQYDYLTDNSEFEPDCYETIYTDKNFDWIVYGSHEGTIAFGGAWLLTELDRQLSDKKELVNQW